MICLFVFSICKICFFFLQTKIEAIKRNIENESERIEELCVDLRFGRLSSKIQLQNHSTPSNPPPAVVQVTKL